MQLRAEHDPLFKIKTKFPTLKFSLNMHLRAEHDSLLKFKFTIS